MQTKLQTLITGMLDNHSEIHSISNLIIEIVKVSVLFLVFGIAVHQLFRMSANKQQQKLWYFSDFMDTLQIIIDCENGCHMPKKETEEFQ